MTRLLSRAVFVFLASMLLPLAAHAQAFRAYLASYGSDANPCTIGQPCRLLPAAINAVATGGEVWILDSANFNGGTVNIAKSVSILVVPGQIGSIVAVNGAPAITITANVSVGLRNVVIAGNAVNPGNHGIVASAGTLLSIEDSLFANLLQNGIVAQNSTVRVDIKNTVFRNNGGFAVIASNGPVVQIADSRLLGNAGGGVKAMGGASNTTTVINVSDSTISGGLEGALASTTNSDAWASIMVTRSTIHDTCNALHADATAAAGAGKPSVIVTNSTVTNNLVGLLQSGTTAVTVVKSLGNNYIGDNGSETGTLTTTPLR